MLRKYDCIDALMHEGITYEDASALRRISMTLHRWHELECGDGNQYGSWAIVRGHMREGGPFQYREDEGRPYLEHHHYAHGKGKDSVSYTLLADRERGALKRLAKIMERYPGFTYYVQGDPRGCALYILRPQDMPDADTGDDFPINIDRWIESNYNRGIAVHK